MKYLKQDRNRSHCGGKKTSNLAWVLIDDPDDGIHAVLFLYHVQTWSFGIRSVSKTILAVEVTRVNAVTHDGLIGTFEHWNLNRWVKESMPESLFCEVIFFSNEKKQTKKT